MTMTTFQLTMRIISGILSAYSILVFLRILLSWFHSESLTRPKEILGSMVDPYLDKFKGIKWLQFGVVDFSPILGITVLSFFLYMTSTLAAGDSLTMGMIFDFLLTSIWSLAAFFLNLIIILLGVSLIMNLRGKNLMIGGLNNLVYKITDKIMSFTGRQTYHMTQGLIVSLVVFLIVRVGGQIGLSYLIPIIRSYLG